MVTNGGLRSWFLNCPHDPAPSPVGVRCLPPGEAFLMRSAVGPRCPLGGMGVAQVPHVLAGSAPILLVTAAGAISKVWQRVLGATRG